MTADCLFVGFRRLLGSETRRAITPLLCRVDDRSFWSSQGARFFFWFRFVVGPRRRLLQFIGWLHGRRKGVQQMLKQCVLADFPIAGCPISSSWTNGRVAESDVVMGQVLRMSDWALIVVSPTSATCSARRISSAGPTSHRQSDCVPFFQAPIVVGNVSGGFKFHY